MQRPSHETSITRLRFIFLEKCAGAQSRPSKQSFSSKYAANYTALKLLQGPRRYLLFVSQRA